MSLKIGELAKATHVSVETIRYYESLKLLNPAFRNESKYRIYSEDSTKRIQFVRNMQALGFSLSEIKELLDLKVQTKSQCKSVQSKVNLKLSEIQGKIAVLKKLESSLIEIQKICESSKSTKEGSCPVLDLMEEGL
ncbi:putative mercuric resistance operon regulatory protein [Leptospira inadai serovar Lyme str. 10]|uniref:Heavy metal-responsive transcriptional regulator n=2 Tax=Leptospira inadai serovar Lyme TaxID=293084 RepID=A0ABX4YD94_9LEPT|nr:MerR family transcriptional regulator [Leptospira inadai]EQA38934.1 putative mercuric resistance operon regulatory protein [Leptospira inadai serovar Lyme str. 10]PNV72109.1 heavy metal-responsive transcriptional regulator [Leptospira inadai serovar Lyme]